MEPIVSVVRERRLTVPDGETIARAAPRNVARACAGVPRRVRRISLSRVCVAFTLPCWERPEEPREKRKKTNMTAALRRSMQFMRHRLSYFYIITTQASGLSVCRLSTTT